jgi:hypothetical protein
VASDEGILIGAGAASISAEAASVRVGTNNYDIVSRMRARAEIYVASNQIQSKIY